MPSGSKTCRAECSYRVASGTNIPLSADDPGGLEFFNGWTVTGAGSSTCPAHVSTGGLSCSVTIYGNMRVAVRYGGPEEPESSEPESGESSSDSGAG